MANDQSQSSSNLQIGTTPSAMIEGGFKWLETMTSTMQSVLQAAQGAIGHVAACQDATLNFALDRMQKNGEAAKAFLQPQDPAALVQSGVEYQKALFEDYAQYRQRLVEMTLATAKDSLDPLGTQTEASLNEVIKAA